MGAVMDFSLWYGIGIKNKWISHMYCETHDGSPLTDEEMDEMDDGGDPCIIAVRLYQPTGGDDEE